jgi:hypothetical protein
MPEAGCWILDAGYWLALRSFSEGGIRLNSVIDDTKSPSINIIQINQ